MICSNPWGLCKSGAERCLLLAPACALNPPCMRADAVLDDAGELRLHLRLVALTDPTLPTVHSADALGLEAKEAGGSCVFKAPVDIAADGWSRIELSITGTMATLQFNRKPVGE